MKLPTAAMTFAGYIMTSAHAPPQMSFIVLPVRYATDVNNTLFPGVFQELIRIFEWNALVIKTIKS